MRSPQAVAAVTRATDNLLDAYSREVARKAAVEGHLWRASDLLGQLDRLIARYGLAAPWDELEPALTATRAFLDEQRDDPSISGGSGAWGSAPLPPAQPPQAAGDA